VSAESQAVGQHRLKGEPEIRSLSRAEEAIIRRSAETRATVPDLELGRQLDARALLELARDRDCSTTSVLVRACALALSEHPYANAAYRDGHYELYPRVNVAVTVQTARTYVAPVVIDADKKPLDRLSAEIEGAVTRARTGELTPPELAGATFTLTDLGTLGVTQAGVLLTPPQAAAIAAGAITPAPVVRDGAVVASHTLSLTLAGDARIMFGARAASFLARIGELLERGRL
jgi:pyruvate dehydrogenase E2 component (dihydrolipoamide acetyltransferase)